ncbi:hypothetical protein PFMG_00219 [Plasmodium falciparum IGH-CR14]|uniref:Uncharacterized protein n=1 Tax=Plasmodium falciparum IGH-CR14 TaxID=580059 RepID=A0A0L1I4Y4_PLAFA|nr:hypothetical protein PFMG_00219 [Plasmodium falciparum IGH-CR14]
MNNENTMNNDDNTSLYHNLRKIRKPRSYDFEYVDDKTKKGRGRKKRRKRRRSSMGDINSINGNVNDTNKEENILIKIERTDSNIPDSNENVENKIEIKTECDINKNCYVSEKTVSTPNLPIRRYKTKKFNLEKSMNLFNTNIPLRNNNIKIDRICEYLNYTTNTMWRYMGSTAKFRLVEDQQEKYLFLKNMKKNIIFEIIKIAMFALLKVNLNDNNIYTLNPEEKKKNEFISKDMNSIKYTKREEYNNNNHNNNSNKINDNQNNDKTKGDDNYNTTNNNTNYHVNFHNNKSNRNNYYAYYFYSKKPNNIENNEESNCDINSVNKENSNGVKDASKEDETISDIKQNCNVSLKSNETNENHTNNYNSMITIKISPACENENISYPYSHYDNSKINISRRLEEKDDILNQGVTVPEILDFVKEKYEKYYENEKKKF